MRYLLSLNGCFNDRRGGGVRLGNLALRKNQDGNISTAFIPAKTKIVFLNAIQSVSFPRAQRKLLTPHIKQPIKHDRVNNTSQSNTSANEPSRGSSFPQEPMTHNCRCGCIEY